MKKFITKTLLVVGLAIGFTAEAQNGFNEFEIPRTIVLTQGAHAATFTNQPVDIHGFVGIAKIDFVTTTNASEAAGTLTGQVFTSPDTTNWTALANYALATSTTAIYTNSTYGGSLKATNTYLLPGVVTTPTAATAGFATPYLAPAPYTNSGTITLTGNTAASIGFNIGDQTRYIRVVFTEGGFTTNYTAAAILTGDRYLPTIP